MATLRLFGPMREAAGCSRDVIDAATVSELLDVALGRYPDTFASMLGSCGVWLNGESIDLSASISEADEVALIPPVSGG